ncbi:glycosyltransferase 52 family protein [Vibrio sp. Hep-1b-8]|uniref:glycosyltransferase 52 family protein n=1 Tax=Vibrio sp. Hep-1b-8 TaxID=2144187 RepID=UPI0011101ADC|nr:glycosyltransferase 52 family protein [Vibrio sp. Hep-1b-8]TMX34657.1 glycosyltransferase 52 family protein [Vibrio sp. Hep-1b-8]
MNLFIATSPFQYICALEAKAHYNTDNNILVLVHQDKEPGISQQMKLFNSNDWDYVIHTERKNRSRTIPKDIRKVKAICGNQKIAHLFHAEYNGWQTKLFLKNLTIEKEVYFDDGSLTINEYEELIRPKKSYTRKRFFSDLTLRLNGCKPVGTIQQSEQLELFTIFDIENPEHLIQKNSLKRLQEKLQDIELYNKSAPLGLIGQGSVGHKNLKPTSDYLKEVSEIVAKSKNGVIYFPHRSESEDIRRVISELPNLRYHYSEYPLEIELVDKRIQLSCLIGCTSTAQFTAKILNPDMPIYNIPLSPRESYSAEMLCRFDRVNRYLSKLGIKEI